ncbi:MAG: cyclohexadienyl dehydrogenase [Rhodospirillaceae bacterium]|nr:cyclohexadienyl dehydrogenase [Rhodospirillaceae bacterium]
MSETENTPFERVALIGIGLICSSLARVIQREGLAREVVAFSRTEETRKKAASLGIVDSVADTPEEAVTGADLVVLGTPVGAYAAVADTIAGHLAEGAIVTDVGSVKGSVIDAVAPRLPVHVHFVPGHPLAGTEHSGPDAGFDTLFQGRWCILTPLEETDAAAVERVAALWRRAGSMVDIMDPSHHDLVLAITSHLPHLIAYNIVGTVTDLEDQTKREVIKYAASGFRDFTRIAASDPVMWRDIFMNNREAVLEMLGRFTEDLSRLQRAIRWGEADTLEALFTRTRDIRRQIIAEKQA